MVTFSRKDKAEKEKSAFYKELIFNRLEKIVLDLSVYDTYDGEGQVTKPTSSL